MSANPTPPPAAYPEPTPADHDAMFRSVVWFREQECPGAYEKYAGNHVAVLGLQVIDLDRDKGELFRRLDAMGDAVPPNRLAVLYVPTLEESRVH